MEDVIGPGWHVGQYHLHKQLGAGRYARVFLATHEVTHRLRALKILNDMSDRVVVARFIEEANLGCSINHPNVACVHDLATEDDACFMVLDYFHGGTLAQLIAESGPQPPAVVVSVGCQLASALCALHKQGIIHRDVKPHNVMLHRRGDDWICPKLIDLGVAHADEHLRLPGSPVPLPFAGTPGYMSPARWRCDPNEPSDDLFSLGVTLYELATANMPWQLDGESRDDFWQLSREELHSRQLRMRAVDPRRHVPGMSRRFAEALLWALEVSPSNRPHDEREYILALALEAPGNELVFSGLELIEWRAPDLLHEHGTLRTEVYSADEITGYAARAQAVRPLLARRVQRARITARSPFLTRARRARTAAVLITAVSSVIAGLAGFALAQSAI